MKKIFVFLQEEEKDIESCDREQADKDVVSIEPRDNDSSPTETMQDDMAEIDSKESLEGVQYRHVVESETVAELEEIIYKEKEKSKLYDMSESAIKGRDITLEEAKVRVPIASFNFGRALSPKSVAYKFCILWQNLNHLKFNTIVYHLQGPKRLMCVIHLLPLNQCYSF